MSDSCRSITSRLPLGVMMYLSEEERGTESISHCTGTPGGKEGRGGGGGEGRGGEGRGGEGEGRGVFMLFPHSVSIKYESCLLLDPFSISMLQLVSQLPNR